SPDLELHELDAVPAIHRFLWRARRGLERRKRFGVPMEDLRLPWWSWRELYVDRMRTPLSIAFAFVATHNHFVLDRGGKVFNRSAPVIKLPQGASEDDHLALLGLLNSSTACFWMKQVFHNKGSTVDQHGARQTTIPFEDFFEFDGTKLKRFPVPGGSVLVWARRLGGLARELSSMLPGSVVARGTPSREVLDAARARVEEIRGEMVAVQEELDWRCLHLYGITDEDLSLPPEGPPPLAKGER